MLVVDTDAHHLEDYRDFLPYIDEPVRTKIANFPPQLFYPSTTGDRNVSGRIKRPPGMNEINQDRTPADGIAGVMEFLGLDITVELPNLLLGLPRFRRREIAFALAKGYVKYMLDQVVDPKRGIYTMVIAPPQVPKRAADLIYEVGEHPGIAAVCLITGESEPPLGDPHYDPIYRAAQDLGLNIVFHGNTAGIDEFPVQGFQHMLETHTLGFPFYNMATLVSVVVQGLPERFPKLKFVFQEAGITYVPMIMLRLDTSYKKRRSEAPLLKRLPGEYIREFYFGTQPLEEIDSPEKEMFLSDVFQLIDGPDQLLFATDYPHWDFNNSSVILQLPFLSKAEKAKILGENALKVFRFAGFERATKALAGGKEAYGT